MPLLLLHRPLRAQQVIPAANGRDLAVLVGIVGAWTQAAHSTAARHTAPAAAMPTSESLPFPPSEPQRTLQHEPPYHQASSSSSKRIEEGWVGIDDDKALGNGDSEAGRKDGKASDARAGAASSNGSSGASGGGNSRGSSLGGSSPDASHSSSGSGGEAGTDGTRITGCKELQQQRQQQEHVLPEGWKACLAVQLMRAAKGSAACTPHDLQVLVDWGGRGGKNCWVGVGLGVWV